MDYCQFGKGLKVGNLVFYLFRLIKVNNFVVIIKKEYGYNFLYKVFINLVGEQRKFIREEKGFLEVSLEVCQENKKREGGGGEIKIE